jgi:hypothetical protein
MLAFLTVLMVGCAATAARAQIARPVSLGVTVGLADPHARQAIDTGSMIGLVARLRRQGWGVAAGFWSFRTESEFLTYSMRPLLIGVVYNISMGRVSLSPSVLVGYTFNDAAVKEHPQRVELTDSFAWEPGLSVSWDASERVGLSMFGGFLVSAPKLDFGNVGGSPPSTFDVDALVWTVGIHVSL